jgi:hypothetical protein
MLSENKKELPFSFPFSAHIRLWPKSPKSADAPSSFPLVRYCSTGRSPTWSKSQTRLTRSISPPWPCARPIRARVSARLVLGRDPPESGASPSLASVRATTPTPRLFSHVLGLLRALARRPFAASLRSTAAGQYRACLRLDPSPWTLPGTNQGRREVRDAEPDLRRPSPSLEGNLCAVATWGRVGRL